MLSGAKTKNVQILRITVAETVKVRHSYTTRRTGPGNSTYFFLSIGIFSSSYPEGSFVTPYHVDL